VQFLSGKERATIVSEMTQTSTDGIWRPGTLDDEELERAAMAYCPSWVLGLDVAKRASLSPLRAALPSEHVSVGFTAADPAVQPVLAASMISLAPPRELGEAPPLEPTPVAESNAAKPSAEPAAVPSAVALDAVAHATAPSVAPASPLPAASLPTPSRLAAKPPVDAPHAADAREAPAKSTGRKVGLVAASLALLAVVGYVAFGSRSSTSSVPSESTVQSAPTPAPEDTAQPAPTPAPEGTAQSAPTPAPEGTAQSAPTPAPEGTAQSAPTPAPEGTAQPAPTPAPEGTAQSAPTPAPEGTAQSAPTPAPEGTAQSATAPAFPPSGIIGLSAVEAPAPAEAPPVRSTPMSSQPTRAARTAAPRQSTARPAASPRPSAPRPARPRAGFVVENPY
jgi:hypothetical protein